MRGGDRQAQPPLCRKRTSTVGDRHQAQFLLDTSWTWQGVLLGKAVGGSSKTAGVLCRLGGCCHQQWIFDIRVHCKPEGSNGGFQLDRCANNGTRAAEPLPL